MKDQYTEDSPSFHKAIFHQLELILANSNFNATPQQIAFLKFVVNQAPAGKGREIKDDTVAAEVFGRGPDYDRSIDPIVSIQASRLRLALVRYYEAAGKNDSIRIHMPRGTYVPVFKKRKLNGP